MTSLDEKFIDFCKLHSSSSEYGGINDVFSIKQIEEFKSYLEAEQIDKQANFVNTKIQEVQNIEKNIVQIEAVNIDTYPPTNQYHFNTFKLNEFLNKKSIERGINIIEDEIKSVSLKENNFIKKIIGEKKEYSADFYID